MTKRLAMLKEIVPAIRGVGLLYYPDDPVGAGSLKEARAAAPTIGISVVLLPFKTADDVDRLVRDAKVDSVIQVAGQATIAGKALADVGLKRRIPTMVLLSSFVDAGGFLSYGPDHAELFGQPPRSSTRSSAARSRPTSRSSSRRRSTSSSI